MKYLKIQNAGLLDHRLIGLMGGTTKENDTFKIGEFGSGLKYTLAYLFRHNIDFKLFVGEQEIKITLQTEMIREEEFEIICIDGHRTSVTTKMGKKWEAWMIIREIWSNALDEGNHFREVTTEISGKPDTTTFYIQVSKEINDVLEKWDRYFIHGIEPMYDCKEYSIYAGGNTLRIYKQGILIKENKETPAVFAYDLKNAEINELREYKDWLQSYDITKCLSDANEKVIQYALDTIKEDHYEGSMDWSWSGIKFSEKWGKVIGNAKLIHQAALDVLIAKEVPINPDELVVVPKNLFIRLNAQFEGISSLRTSDKIHEFYEIYDAELELKIKSALATLETCGYFISPELKFLHGIFGDKTILAQVCFDKKEILVSEQLKNKPMFNFIAMIVEENEHFRTALHDCSRNFQQHWINLFVKTLLEKNVINV